jgi:DNA-directed RNA polymerase subunit RPC12/RpoP
MIQKKQGLFLHHYDCQKCGKPVRTNVDWLNQEKLCHDCGRLKKLKKKQLVERILADRNLMDLIEKFLEAHISQKAVKYTCPKCGEEGQFAVMGSVTQEEIDTLKNMPQCPRCMMRDLIEQKKEGEIRTQGPVGPVPRLIDPESGMAV